MALTFYVIALFFKLWLYFLGYSFVFYVYCFCRLFTRRVWDLVVKTIRKLACEEFLAVKPMSALR